MNRSKYKHHKQIIHKNNTFNNTIQFNRLHIYLFRKTQINTATYTLSCNYIHPLQLINLYILSISRHIKVT